jgi:hypothetical protein
VGFVVDKMALGQVFSEYSVSPANLPSTNCSTITLIYHLGLYNRPEVAAVPGDVIPTPLKKTIKSLHIKECLIRRLNMHVSVNNNSKKTVEFFYWKDGICFLHLHRI